MKKYFSILETSPLFLGIRGEELGEMLNCLNARSAAYPKQEILLLQGQPAAEMGMVLSGSIQIIKEDFGGNRTILAELGPGELFAESFACARVRRLPVTAAASSDSEVLWMDYRRVVSTCPSACPYHTKLIENMLAILASKNLLLNQKIEHLSKHTTREKLLSYLSDQAARRGETEFDIPFNRQELADYLCVDRSALSAELSRMQREGLLHYHRSHFIFPES